MKLRAVEAYQAVYPDPIRVQAGEVVRLGREDDEFPGWTRCTDPRGREGWMPQAFFEVGEAVALATALVDYDARELTVALGDELELRLEHEGWLLCQDAAGQGGWIPKTAALGAELLDWCDGWLDAWTGNDPERLLAFYADDAVYQDPAARGVLRGRAQFGPWITGLLAANPEWTWTREQLMPTDKGFTLKWRAVIPVGAGVVEEYGLDIVEVKAGRIVRNEVFFDRTALLRALRAAG